MNPTQPVTIVAAPYVRSFRCSLSIVLRSGSNFLRLRGQRMPVVSVMSVAASGEACASTIYSLS